MAAVAALCVQYEADFRPNMSIVVKALQPLLNTRSGPPTNESPHLWILTFFPQTSTSAAKLVSRICYIICDCNHISTFHYIPSERWKTYNYFLFCLFYACVWCMELFRDAMPWERHCCYILLGCIKDLNVVPATRALCLFNFHM